MLIITELRDLTDPGCRPADPVVISVSATEDVALSGSPPSEVGEAENMAGGPSSMAGGPSMEMAGGGSERSVERLATPQSSTPTPQTVAWLTTSVWPSPSTQEPLKRGTQDVQRPGMKTQSHFDISMFKQHGMTIACADVECKFSKKPKYDVQIEAPNDFNVNWLYSVPYGEDYCKS